MRIWEYESMRVWEYENMRVWEYESMRIWEYENMRLRVPLTLKFQLMKFFLAILFFINFLKLSGQQTPAISKLMPSSEHHQFNFLAIKEVQANEKSLDFFMTFPSSFSFPLPSPFSQPFSQLQPYLNHLPGMFCKWEHKMESKSKLAPRFRLGSLNYTNWMEGKGELYSRYWKW